MSALANFFNDKTAIVFFDVKPNNDVSKMFKVVSYISNYDPNLGNASWTGSALPYRELYSVTQGGRITTFRGNVSGLS
jgi:hypothetical protein